MVQRLPYVSGDDGQWGAILNNFLGKEHFDNTTDTPLAGGHKTVTLVAGTTAANTAPLTFNSGSLMTTPQVGAVEFLTDKLYVTQTTGTTRKAIATYFDGTGGATGDMYYRDASGNYAPLAIGGAGTVLTGGGTIPVWSAGGSGMTQQQTMAISSMRI